MVMFLALHPLLVSVRESGGVDDVVEGVDGQVEQLQVRHGDPGATHRHRRLQSEVSKANCKAASISIDFNFFYLMVILFPARFSAIMPSVRSPALTDPEITWFRSTVFTVSASGTIFHFVEVIFYRSVTFLLGCTSEGFKVCPLSKFLCKRLQIYH